MTTVPTSRGAVRWTASRLKRLLAGEKARSTSIEIGADDVLKHYESAKSAQLAADRLYHLQRRLDGVAKIPTVLDVKGPCMRLERIPGRTLWEMCREAASAPNPTRCTELSTAIAECGRILGRLHSATHSPCEPNGDLHAVFQEESTRYLAARQMSPEASLQVASHGDFAPVNILVRPSGELVILDPDPNFYVTATSGLFTRYVDIGLWCSALTARLPGRGHRTHRARVLEALHASLEGYAAEVHQRVDYVLVSAYARATTSAYLRTHRLPRAPARFIANSLTPYLQPVGRTDG